MNNKVASKLPSLSLLVDTTRIATSLLRKNHKSSNIDPHSFYLFLCLLFNDQILAPLPGRERLYCSILKIFLCSCVWEKYKGAYYQGKRKRRSRTLREDSFALRKIRVIVSFFDWSTNKLVCRVAESHLKKNLLSKFLVSLDASPLCMYNKLNRNSLVT